MLTTERLAEIDARINDATPGPWHHHDMESHAVVGPDHISLALCEARHRTDEQNAANTRFVIEAREDVPELVAEVRRLRAAIAKHRSASLESSSIDRELWRTVEGT